VRVYLSVYIHMYIYISIYIYMHTHTSRFNYFYVYVYMYIVYKYTSIQVYILCIPSPLRKSEWTSGTPNCTPPRAPSRPRACRWPSNTRRTLRRQHRPWPNKHGNDFVCYSAVEPDSLMAFFRHFWSFLSFGCM